MKIIVGLGNPGAKYENTYHNVGFTAVNKLANFLGGKFLLKSKLKAEILECFYKGEKVIVVKPQTYMNLSGESVRAVLNFYKADLSNLLVVYDDLDLEVGAIRFRNSGSAGTHNGMKNILLEIQSGDFPRARIGIKKDNALIPTIDYVLSKIVGDRATLIDDACDKATKLCLDFIENLSNEKIMCKYNGKAN